MVDDVLIKEKYRQKRQKVYQDSIRMDLRTQKQRHSRKDFPHFSPSFYPTENQRFKNKIR